MTRPDSGQGKKSLEAKKPNDWKLAGYWSYQTAQGKDFAGVGRLDSPTQGKTYRPVHKIPGGWLVGDPPGLWPLYNSAAVSEEADLVVFVEGEKCADIVRGLGFTGTTSAHGAKFQPEKSDFTPLARAGLTVAILADNDEPSRQWRLDTALHIVSLCSETIIKFIDLPGLINKGDDIEQWREHEGTTEELRELIEAADRASLIAPKVAVDTGCVTGGGVTDTALEYRLHDQGNAERFVKAADNTLAYRVPDGTWMHFNSKHWEHDEILRHQSIAKKIAPFVLTDIPPTMDKEIVQLFNDHSLKCHSRRTIEDAIKLSQSMLAVKADVFDKNEYLFNCESGTIDTVTGTLHPHSRSDLITNISPVVFGPKSQCPRWDDFLIEVMGDRFELVQFLCRAAGYSMTASVIEQVMFFLHGDGANGKSVFLNTLQAVLGTYACSIRSELLTIKRNEEHPTGLTDLQGKRFIATIEVADGKKLAEALVKMLTGGDKIRARKMRQDYYEFSPTFKLWLAANHKPEIRGLDHGIWRRILLIPFDVKIPKARQDGELFAKLMKESSGILNWLLCGVADWQKQGLNPPQVVIAATEEYKAESDTLGQFLEESCEIGETYRAPFGALYRRYDEWSNAQNVRPISSKAFGSELTKRQFGVDKSHGERIRTGLMLKAQTSDNAWGMQCTN